MADIPRNYPDGSTNDEIIAVINQLSSEILQAGGHINTVMQLVPFITVGQMTLLQRSSNANIENVGKLHKETQKLRHLTKQNVESSDKFAKSSRVINYISLAVSLLAMIISIYFGYAQNKSDLK